MRAIKRYETAAMVAMALVSAVMTAQAADPIGQNDMVFGTGNGPTGKYATSVWTRWYDASKNGGTWSDGPGSDANEPSYISGTGSGSAHASWDQPYLQSMEFDNTAGRLHNPSGNLLGVNYGNGFTGLTIYGLATDGTDNVTTNYATGNSPALFSMKYATNGTVGTGVDLKEATVTKGALSATFSLTERGGGLSFSSRNDKIAWIGTTTGSIFVMDYNAGTTPGKVTVANGTGTTAGASISGPRMTAHGGPANNSDISNAIAMGASAGTTWINNNVVMAYDVTGRMVMWNVANVAAGNMNGSVEGVTVTAKVPENYVKPFTPNIDAGWTVVAQKLDQYGVGPTHQYTDIEYNPMINPNIIITSATNSDYSGEIHLWNFDPITGAVSLNKSLALPNYYEPREIAFDSQGNLFMCNYTDKSKPGLINYVTELVGAGNPANWTTPTTVVFQTEETQSNGKDWYAGFNGMDVASGLIDVRAYGDYNNDGNVTAADYTVWADSFGQQGYFMWADGNADGLISAADYTIWADHFGLAINTLFPTTSNEALSGSNIPEPTSIGLLAITAAGLLIRRRQA